MKTNIGTVDKLIRFLTAALLLILVIGNLITGTFAIISLILAGVLILTSLMNFCPLYSVLGLSTRKRPHSDSAQ